MLIVGDVHGKIRQYLAKIEGKRPSFQIGDMGLGFGGIALPELKGHMFIRGNHDKPEACREHPNYAGEYGYMPEQKIFFLGGAWSIDQAYRVEGISWWRDEELSYEELQKACDLFVKEKPEIVLTHDCPETIGELVVASGPGFYILGQDGKPTLAGKIATRTGQALQRMFEQHQPELWVFGHYHVSFDKVVNETRFVCLNELETFSL